VKFKIKIKQKTVTRRLSEHRIENRRWTTGEVAGRRVTPKDQEANVYAT
jgi:hypothetical protein